MGESSDVSDTTVQKSNELETKKYPLNLATIITDDLGKGCFGT